MTFLHNPIKFWSRLGVFLLLTLAFSISYTQSPLYTSNQNQYYLHGMAAAGYGQLAQDWLASTFDPAPVFSFLIQVTYLLIHSEILTYLYYALLMGLYLWGLMSIIESVFPIRRTPAGFVLFLALVVLVHSAALRFALSHLIDVNWTYVFEDGLADQRLLGPVFQPSVFGIFLVVSIALFLRGRAGLAALFASLAATFHPTYLLSAGTLTCAYMLSQFMDRPESKKTLPRFYPSLRTGLIAFVVVLPILMYVYLHFGNTPQETSARAQDLLVNYRIPHHARIDWWLDLTAGVKFMLLAAGLWLARRTRLFTILATCLAVGTGLTVIQALTGSNTLALLFPWRMSTFLVPISSCLILAWLITRLTGLSFVTTHPRPSTSIFLTGGLGLLAACVLVGSIRLVLDFQRQVDNPERPIEAYIATHLAPGQTYLTPIKLEEFRLASGAPAYVDFKSIPYQDLDMLEWYRRVHKADRFYKTGDCGLLNSFIEEGVTHLVLPVPARQLACPQASQLYRDDNYGLYALTPR